MRYSPYDDLDTYQTDAMGTAKYPQKYGIVYTALKLAGEAGEYAEKIGKVIRDDGDEVNDVPSRDAVVPITFEKREELIKELGDVLWYVAAAADELRVPMSYIAERNVEKLKSRLENGTIGGSGDER